MRLQPLYGHGARIFDVHFAPDADKLVTASEDGSARVWAYDEGCSVQEACLMDHSAEVMRAAWHPEATRICTGSADKTAKIWRLAPGYDSEVLGIMEGHSEELYCCDWVQNGLHAGSHLLTVSGSMLRLWDTGGAKPVMLHDLSLSGHAVDDCIPEMWRNVCAFGCAQASGAPLIACPCCDGVTQLARLGPIGPGSLALGPSLNVAADLGAAVMCLYAAFSPSGAHLAVLTSGGDLVCYAAPTWCLVAHVAVGSAAMAIKWADDAYVLVTCGGSIVRVRIATGYTTSLSSMWPQRRLLCLDVSPHCGRIAASGNVVEADSAGPALLQVASSSGDDADPSDVRGLGELFKGAMTLEQGDVGGAGRGRRRPARGRHRAQEADSRAPVEFWEASDFEEDDMC